ncbi:MAG: GntR family transcriptional regulator [Bacilli bacterium]|nr:GntR family transcriptional regulator [Bacilli bacterium]
MKEIKNLSEIAYEKIKHMILNGDLKQGQAISICTMAETLQISRTPVSNACQRLEFEKLLTVIPKQGVIINTISIDAACGLFELRSAIETYNAKKVVEYITQNDIDILNASIQKQKEYAEYGDCAAFTKEDVFFHKYILEKNINPELHSVINPIYDRIHLLSINGKSPRMSLAVKEHEQIVAELQKKDGQSLAEAINNNILNGLRDLTLQLLG